MPPTIVQQLLKKALDTHDHESDDLWDWRILDAGNAGITRAALDSDGDLWIQNLHVKTGANIPIPKEAIPAFCSLLHSAAPVAYAMPEAQTLLTVVQTLLTSASLGNDNQYTMSAEDYATLSKAAAHLATALARLPKEH